MFMQPFYHCVGYGSYIARLRKRSLSLGIPDDYLWVLAKIRAVEFRKCIYDAQSSPDDP